jgi:thiol-disulfide isomerase/thioredoxin
MLKKISIVVFFMTLLNQFSEAQNLRVLSFEQLQPLLIKKDTTVIVNFWATWCGPCVQELPFFKEAASKWNDKPIKFVFVSVDFLSQTQKVKDKVAQLGLPGLLVQLNEHEGDWIDKLDHNWSGAIPYTVIFYPSGMRKEHYDAFNSLDDLQTFLSNNIQ